MMRTLLSILLLHLYTTDCPAQQDPLDGWSFGGYNRVRADILSSVSNVAALTMTERAGIAVNGLRQYGLPELDVY